MWTTNFAWEGALVAFLTFNATIGVNIAEQAIRSLSEDYTSTPERSARAEGAGHVLNYLIQVVAVTFWGGYLTGWAYERKSLIFSPVIFFVMGAILLWYKLFSDTRCLRQLCMRLVDFAFPQISGGGAQSPSCGT